MNARDRRRSSKRIKEDGGTGPRERRPDRPSRPPATRRQQRGEASRNTANAPEGARGEWLYGRHPLLETLRDGRRHIHEIWLPEESRHESPDIAELRRLAQTADCTTRVACRGEIDTYLPNMNHQGVAARVGHYPYGDFEAVLHRVRQDALARVLLLDHLEDPQNVGALMRTAEAMGITAVVLPRDRAVGVTPAVVRASAGASEHLLIVQVVNLPRAIVQLQEDAGACVLGLDRVPDAREVDDIDWRQRIGIVIGAEGRGLGRLVRERCNGCIQIPMRGKIGSLNASVAGGIALFEAARVLNAPVPQ